MQGSTALHVCDPLWLATQWNAMQYVTPVYGCLWERHMCTARKVPVHVSQALTPWVIHLSVCANAARQSAKTICSACCAIHQSIYQSSIHQLCLHLTFCSVKLPSMSSRILPLCSVSSAKPRTSAMISGSRHSPASLFSSFLPYLMRSSLRAAKQHLQHHACQ